MDHPLKITQVPASVRPGREADLNFIYHSWLKSYRASWAKGTNPVRSINKEIYYMNQKEIIRYLIDQSIVLVAHNPQDYDQIFGYIIGQPSAESIGIVHYCFVKQPFRTLGIGTLLLAELRRLIGHDSELPMAATHATGVFHAALADKYNIIFNPYLVYREFIEHEDQNTTYRTDH
jgi:hypothetical protein